MSEWMWYSLLIPAGFVAGVINTIAGGGSFLTLPALMFICGLDPRLANGTNRVAILLSSASASATFHKHGHLDKKLAARLALPTLLGVPVGSWGAVTLPAQAFEPIFGAIFLVMATILIVDPKRLIDSSREHSASPMVVFPLFFAIGVYVGFIQAGMGILLLLGMSILKTGDLVASNAIKNSIGFLVTLAALLVFIVNDMIAWLPGLIMAVGNVLGGVVGAKLAIRKGNRLIVVFMIIVMIATGIELVVPD
jgi:uncharacterized membrane protein YfcA